MWEWVRGRLGEEESGRRGELEKRRRSVIEVLL